MRKIKILKMTILSIAVFGLGFFVFFAEALAAFVAPECSDGRNNDGDEFCDFAGSPYRNSTNALYNPSCAAMSADPQCLSAIDDHESDNVRSFFFKAHSTYNEKIPANTTISSRSAGAVSNMNNNTIKGFFVNTGEGLGTNGGAYNTYVADDTYENVILKSNASANDKYIAAATTAGWNLVPLKSTSLAVNNSDKCANPSIYYDNHMEIISQDGTKIWDLYQISNCSSPYNKNEWYAGSVRMYYNTENGVDSQSTENWLPRGDMYGTWNDNYTSNEGDGLGAPTSMHTARLSGSLTYDEVANGTIDHALEFTWKWRCSPANVWLNSPYPAANVSSKGFISPGCTEYHPMAGERFQLNLTHAEIDALATTYGWNQPKRNILYAIADYGMLMSEATGGDPDGKTFLYLHVVNEPAHSKTQWASLFGGGMEAASYYPLVRLLSENLRLVPSPHPPYINQGQCADGIDNDNPPDGKIDYPADPGCSSAYGDDDETSNSADVNSDNQINIKDIQICIKAIVAPDSFTTPDQLKQLTKCKAVVPPTDVVNIKDIQEIVRAIIGN